MTDDNLNSENAAKNTYEIAKDTKKGQTSWNEQKRAPKQALEASSTTYAKNSRFGLFENGEWVTPDGFDELVTKNNSLYELTVPAGETLDFPEGDVTIDTVNGHMRGEQISKAVYDGNSRGGGSAEADVDSESRKVNEFNLFVAVAKHDDITENIIRKIIITEESW